MRETRNYIDIEDPYSYEKNGSKLDQPFSSKKNFNTASDIYHKYMQGGGSVNINSDYLNSFINSVGDIGAASSGAVATLAQQGIDPNSDVGSAIQLADAKVQGQADLAEHKSNLEGDGSWDWMTDKLKGALKVGIAGLEASAQIVSNWVEIGIGSGWGALTPGGFVEAVEGTDLSKMVAGIGNEDPQLNDFGDGWFIDPESPAAQYGVEQGQRRLQGDDWGDIYERDENGNHIMETVTNSKGEQVERKKLKEGLGTEEVMVIDGYGNKTVETQVVDRSPSTSGQWMAANLFGAEVGSDAYHNVSGFADFMTAFLDPSFYVGAGAVRQTARTTGNMALKAAGKEAKYATKADEAAVKSAGEDVLTASKSVTKSDEYVIDVLADVQRRYGAVLDEVDGVIKPGANDVLTDAMQKKLYTLSADLKRIADEDAAARVAGDAATRADALVEGARKELRKQLYNRVRKNQDKLATGKLTDEAAAELSVTVEEQIKILYRLTDEADALRGRASQGKDAYEAALARHENLDSIVKETTESALSRSKITKGERGKRLIDPDAPGGYDDLVKTTGVGEDVLEAFYGVIASEKSVNIDRAMAMMMKSSNRHAKETIDLMARTDDAALIVDATRGKINGDMALRLADAKTPQEIKNILAEGVTAGTINPNVGKLRGFRYAANRRFDGNPDNLLPWYLKSIPGGYDKLSPAIKSATLYVNEAYTSRVPWARPVDTENLGGLVNLIGDSATYFMKDHRPQRWGAREDAVVVDQAGNVSLESAKEFRRKWMNRMLRTNSSAERQMVWKNYVDAQITRKTSDWGLNPDEVETLRKSFQKNWDEATNAQKLGAEMRASLSPNQRFIYLTDGTKINVADHAALEQHLNTKIISPDWSQLRKVLSSKAKFEDGMKAAKNANKDGSKTHLNDFAKHADAIFNRYWRASILGLRGAYIVRNLGDIQFRMFLKGHPSMFTALPGIVAMAMSKGKLYNKEIEDVNQRVRDKIFSRPASNNRLTGDEAFEVNADGVWNVAGAEQTLVMAGSRFDPLAGQEPGWYKTRNYSPSGGPDRWDWRRPWESLWKDRELPEGYQTVVVTDDGRFIIGDELPTDAGMDDFINGLAHELTIATRSPMAMDFLNFATKVDDKGRYLMDDLVAREQFVVDLLNSDSFKELYEGSPKFRAMLAKRLDPDGIFPANMVDETAGGKALPSSIEENLWLDPGGLSARKALDKFLFGDDPYSYQSWFGRHFFDEETITGQPRLVDHMFDVPPKDAPVADYKKWERKLKRIYRETLVGEDKYWREVDIIDPNTGKVSYTGHEPTERLDEILKARTAAEFDDLGASVPPISLGSHFSLGKQVEEIGKARKGLRAFDRVMNSFFKFSGRVESATGYLPEWSFSYWDGVVDSVRALSKEDAATIVARAEKELGGYRAPNSWAATTLRRIKKEAKETGDSSAFTLDDLDEVAGSYATAEVERLFYNAANRNQLAHAVRYIAPFLQPFLNTLKIWGAESGRNFNQVVKVNALYEGARGDNSNSMFQALPWYGDDPGNPDDSMIYRDQTTGEMMVSVPGMNALSGLLVNAANMNPMRSAPMVDPGSLGSSIPMQNMNIAFQSGMMPGFGPVVTIPAAALSGFYETAPIPNFLLEELTGGKRWDAEEDGWVTAAAGALPSWAMKGLSSAPGLGEIFGDALNVDAKIRKYYKTVSMNLLASNYGAYGQFDENGNPIPLDQEGLDKLNADVENFSQNMLFTESIVQWGAPGAPRYDIQMPNMLDGDNAVDERIKYASWQMVAADYMQTVRETGDRDRAMRDIMDRYGADAVFQMLPSRAGTSEYRPSNDAKQFISDNPGLVDKYESELSYFFPYGGYSSTLARIQANKDGYESVSLEERMRAANDVLKSGMEAKAILDRNNGKISYEEYLMRIEDAKILARETPGGDMSPTAREEGLQRIWDAANDSAVVEAAPEVAQLTRNWMVEREKLKRAGGATADLSADKFTEARRAMILMGERWASETPEWRALWETYFLPEMLQPREVK